MSKNTEAIDTTKIFVANLYNKQHQHMLRYSYQLTNKGLFRVKYKNWRSSYLALLFFFC